MIRIGNFLFPYRNALFPLAALLFLVPSPRVFPRNLQALALGLAIIVAGQALRALTIGLFYIKRGGRDKRVYAEDLVTEGMFGHCRNPLYLGNVLMLLGFGIAINSLVCLFGGGVFFVFAYSAIVAAEEDYLRKKFGAGYDEYCGSVPRWGIRLHGLGETLRSAEFRWRRLLIREYGTFGNWTMGLPVILYLKPRIHGPLSFDWRGTDGVLLVAAAAAGLFWTVVRCLKKKKLLVAD